MDSKPAPGQQDAKVDREGVREAIARAFEAGCQAVHENYQEDRDPDFTEAASDYAADAILALSASPTPSEAGLRETAKRVAQAVMVWGQPHFKHIVSFNTLCEAVENALASSPPSSEADTVLRDAIVADLREEAERSTGSRDSRLAYALMNAINFILSASPSPPVLDEDGRNAVLETEKAAFTFAYARGFEIAETTSRSCLGSIDDAWAEYVEAKSPPLTGAE